MKISDTIKTLQDIQAKFGDIAITGGFMADDVPLSSITVTDSEGREIWPTDPNGVVGTDKEAPIDGVFLQ